MKTAGFLLVMAMFITSCKKESLNAMLSPSKTDVTYTLSSTDPNYNYRTDTILTKVNGQIVQSSAYVVHLGDSVSVYYNPGMDQNGNIDINQLKIVYNGGEHVLMRYDCHCYGNFRFVVTKL